MKFTIPCAPGVAPLWNHSLENFDEALVPLLDGLHFHTLCEQDSDALEKTAEAVSPVWPVAVVHEVDKLWRRAPYYPDRL